jgi:hypothetical protein
MSTHNTVCVYIWYNTSTTYIKIHNTFVVYICVYVIHHHYLRLATDCD